MESDSADDFIQIYGTHARCRRCGAKSKRSQQRCRGPAMRGKRVCRIHGGKATGPRTLEGRQRCAEVKRIHGKEGRAQRAERTKILAELTDIEDISLRCGLMVGNRRPGPRRSRQ
jgi:hypothetical protein